MTKRHVIDYYMDGHAAISFCKVCSAEGLKLFEECPGKIVDEKKQPDNNTSIENSAE